jgi:fructose-1,6-bisphosphatase
MAQFFPYFNNIPLEDQIKALADDELLDFWEETQLLNKFLSEEEEEEMHYQPNTAEYEQAILQELRLRSCMGPVGTI